MGLYTLREQAYSAIDKILIDFETGRILTIEEFHPNWKSLPYYPMMYQIITQFKLLSPHGGKVGATKYAVTVTGMNVIDAGGIREFLLDNDTGMTIHGGYPKVMTLHVGTVIFDKFLIANPQDEEQLRKEFPNFELSERYSRRQGALSPDRSIPTPIPPATSTTINIAGSVGISTTNPPKPSKVILSKR